VFLARLALYTQLLRPFGGFLRHFSHSSPP
jgi:hypothetical protein